MGQGIAQWFAQQNVQVELTDLKQQTAEQSVMAIHSSWNRLEQKGKFTPEEIKKFKSNLVAQTTQSIYPNVDLVIEAIIEKLEAKRELFQFLDKHLAEDSILATNTSSFSLAALGQNLCSSRQTRFLGLHFFNPAPIMKLVEIIRTNATEINLCQNFYTWFEQHGKKPALCTDSPAFIVNRVARNFYGEPLRIATQDHPEAFQQIDEVMKKVGGFKMGPFELMDLIGVDVNYAVTESTWTSYHFEERFQPHPLQKKLVEAGRLGRKVGRGFYRYE